MDISIGRTFLLTVVALLSTSAYAQPGPFRLTDYSGEEIFMRFCSSCHGETAHGDGPVAATLNVVVPDLTQLTRRYGGEFPAAELSATIDGRSLVIAHGPRTMPVWGYEFWWEEGADREAEAAARETIRKLLDYLLSIQDGG